MLARLATAVLANAVGLPNSEVAFALAMEPVASARLRFRPVDGAVIRAVRMRIALEDAAASSPSPPRPPLLAAEADEPHYGEGQTAFGRDRARG